MFSDYRTFLEVAQTFEDALRIHSVEPRHAAEIRRLRGVKPWTGTFDEALCREEVLAMVLPFIRQRA